MFVSTMLLSVELLFLTRTLDLSPALAGIFISTGALAAAVAVLLHPKIRRMLGNVRVLTVPVLLFWPLGLLMPLTNRGYPWLYVAGSAALAIGGVLFNIEQAALRQTITPNHLRGRMNATMRVIMWGPMPLGALAGGFLAESLSPRAVLWFVAGGMIIAVGPLLSIHMHPDRGRPSKPKLQSGATA